MRTSHRACAAAPQIPTSPSTPSADLFLLRHGAAVTPRTIQTISERLAPARAAFGSWTLSELEGAADDIAAWRAALPTTAAYRHTLALRQVLAAAQRWGYIARNPAVAAGPNPEQRSAEIRPFSREQIDALALELGATYGPLVIFAAETGLRTNEWVALERRDIDRAGPAVLVQRRYADGVPTPYPKTARRRVPLSQRAADALEALPPRLDTPLLFPAPRGGLIGLDTWRTRDWYPAWRPPGSSAAGPTRCGTPSPPRRWRQA